MSKNNYNDGWQDGYWSGSSSAYDRGYEEGVQAERNRIKNAVSSNSPTDESSTLSSMIGGSIALALFGWCFVGLILLLFWIGGSSEEWWFPWIWRIAFWGGIGFIVVISIAGVIMAIAEYREDKNPPEKPANSPNILSNRTDSSELWKKKYPLKDTKAIEEAEIVNNQDK